MGNTTATDNATALGVLDQHGLAIGFLSILAIVIGYLTLIHEPYTPLPVFGHLFSLAGRPRQSILEYYLAASRHFDGRPWRNDIPMVGRGWVINDPADLKYVLTTKHAAFAKGRFFEGRTRDIFTTRGRVSYPPHLPVVPHRPSQAHSYSILLATGERWKAQRTAGHTFVTPPTLKHFSDVTLKRNLHVLLDPLDKVAQKGVAVDLQAAALDFSLAVFGEIAFDTNWENMSANFSQPFDNAGSAIADRFTMPIYSLFEFFLPYGHRLRSNLSRVHAFSQQLVREALEEIQEEAEGKREIKEGKGLLVRGLLETGIEKDETLLANSCLNFLTAGRDTTGQAISWTVYLLLQHPSYISQVVEEIESLPPNTPSHDLATHLPLLEATISESLRLQPPVPFEILENVSGGPISLPSGAVIKPRHQVLWSPWVMARLPGFWGHDADSFRPERWFDMPRKPTAYEWPVFHAGPRSCLGQPLARLELTCALVELFRRFSFTAGWEGERYVETGLTAPIKGGLPVRVTRR